MATIEPAPPGGGYEGFVVNGPKLIRLESALASVRSELQTVDPGSVADDRVDRLVLRLLVEVGSCLPEPLLEELRRLVGPNAGHGRVARLTLAQLEGWLGAVAMEALSALSAGQVVPAADGAPSPG